MESQFYNSGWAGLQIDANALRVKVVGGSASDNSVTAGSGVAPGTLVKAGASNFSITGLSGINSSESNTQQSYAVQVEPGASDRYIIQGKLVSGNVTGGVSDGGTCTNKLVQGNF